MNQTKAAYPMRQMDLYTVANSIWNSTNNLLPTFAAFKSTYNAALIAAQQNAIAAAQALPDFQARNAAAETTRNELEQILKPQILNLWQRLKRYIAYANPAMNHKAEWDAAGASYYTEASASNWDALAQLIQSAQNYLTNNLTALIAVGMPATFTTDFDTLALQFTALHSQFIAERQSAYIATETKITANNQLYTDLTALCADAKLLFQDSPATLKQFTISELIDMITGAGQAGLRGLTLDATTGSPISDVTIEIAETGDTTLSDANGNYTLTGVPAGTYTLIAATNPRSTAQPLTLTTTIVVIKGTISTKNLELVTSLDEDSKHA